MYLHHRWPHRWVNKKARAGKSEVHGRGLFAIEPIQKDQIVLVYGGVVVPKEEIAEYWEQMGHVGIQIDDGFFIVPTLDEELERQGVVNHSCDPNTGFKDQIELIALRNILPGEEITFDYAFCETLVEDFSCNCGSKNCRHKITKNDWKLPEIRKKYGQYFSPYLKNRLTNK